MKMGHARRGVAGIIAIVIIFAILFTVGTSYYVFVEAQNAKYAESLLAAANRTQGSQAESMTVTTLLESNGDVGLFANDTSTLPVNMTAALIISSTGALLECLGVGFPAGAGCTNSTPALPMSVNPDEGSKAIDTGYAYASGTTVTVKVLTSRGNTYTATYPESGSQSGSTQSVTVNLDNLKWVQLVPQASSLVQKKYVSNCNAAACAASFTSSVTAGNILVDGIGWANQNPPATPTDTRGDSFTLGASSSVIVPATPALVQDKYTSNCNAASCGLAFSSNVGSGNTLVYAVGWSNQSPPSAPTDTRGDSFTLGASNSVTITPPTPALIQHRYNSNCSSATCALAFTSSVTAGNTLVLGLGWPFTQPYPYVPITVTNCQSPQTLAIDGSGTGTFSSTNSGSVSVTTTKANDIVVVLITNEDQPNAALRTVSNVSATGLTFAEKGSPVQLGSPSYQDTEVWWALDSSPGTDSISVTLSGNTDDAAVVAFGVSGANTSSPWDSNSALPATATSAGGSAPSVSGVSTTNANDMIIGLQGNGEGTGTASTVETAGTGMTLIQNVDNEGGANSDDAAAEYEIVSSAQSSASVAFGTSTYSADAWMTIANAIQQGTGCNASGSLALDGWTGAGTQAASTSASLTTASTNDVIVLFTGTSSSSTSVSSVSDTGGHAWSHRQTETGSTTVEEEEWYTIASAPLASDSITVTWSATGNNVFTAFGVSGANNAAPFDPNSSLAAVATGATTSPTVSVTTSYANDLIVGMLANEHTSAATCHTETYGSGFSEFQAENSLGGSTCMNSDDEYETVSSTQSGLAIPFTTNTGGSNQWAEIGDAIQAAPATATPNPFQQMVTWDPATYSSYERASLGNVRFCADTACNTPLYAWLESCSSTCSSAGSSSTSATAWVRLTSSIASGSSLTIYMVFEATSVNFDGNYWGEAPQLSGTYAQYDNGASVFNFYDDFAGATLSSKWQTVIWGGGTVSVNNGLTISATSTSYNPMLVSKSTYTPGVLDTDLSLSSEQTALSTPTVFYATVLPVTSGGDAGFKTAYRYDWYQSPAAFRIITDSGGTYAAGQTSAYTLPSTYNIWSATWSGTGSEAFAFNYAYQYVATDSHITYGSAYVGTGGVQGGVINEYWTRLRAIPPNDVMPVVTIGAVNNGGVVDYVPVTITNSQSSATPNPFQQMITWNPSSYSAYEATNLGNLRFCADTACSTPLYSWLESCSSACSTAGSSSTSATAWVQLTSSIAANGGQLTIYMAFDSTLANFDGNYWGEAPQLSPTYAQYDNGANVFLAYFDGNTATSSFSVYTGYALAQAVGTTGPGGSTINAIKATGYNAANPVFSFGTALSNAGTIAESSFSSPGCSSPGADSGVVGLVNNAAAGSVNNAVSAECGYNIHYFDQDYEVGGTITQYSNAQGTATSSWLYATLTYAGTGASSWSAYIAPQLYSATGGYSGTVNNNPLSAATHLYLGQLSGTNSNYPLTIYYNFDRARAYPPSDVMPSASLGSITGGSGAGSLPSVTDTLSDSFTLGASQTASSGTTTYQSAIWYATASSSATDTVTATFSVSVAGSISIYEITGYSTSGVMSSTGSSSAGSTAASVSSFTPSSNSFVVGNVETGSSSTQYTVGSGYTTVASGVGGCDATHASQGCGEYELGLGSATTTPFTLSASTQWADVAASFAPLATNSYYSYVWYATAASSGADTISASFGSTVAGSVSIYELSGVTATGLLSSTGGSSTSQGATAVTSINPSSTSVLVGNAEGASTTFTAGAGYTLSGACSTVGGCGEYQTGVSSATTVPFTISPSSPWVEAALSFAPSTTTYYSYVWYATAASSGADTITATFGQTVTGSVSIYEITGYTTSGVLSSTGSLSTGSTSAAVNSFTPASDSFIVGAAEGSTGSTTYTATSGFTLVGTCNSVGGCSEYNAGGGGSASTVPITLGASTPWVEAALAFSTPFNPQSGIQVGGYPTMGVPSGASLVWEVTFTNVDPNHRAVTIWPQTELAIGSAEFDGFDTDFTQEHYYIIDSLNAGSTTVNGYTSTTGQYTTLAYGVPTTLYFAATTALGSTTQAFGTNVLTPFEAYFALTGIFSDGTLYGETIPYPYGIITQASAYTTPTAGTSGTTVTVSCTSPCHFSASSKALVGWINSAGVMTPLTTFTTTAAGNIPAGVTFAVPTSAAGYDTIEVTDYTNTVFMTFQHT